MKYIMSIVWSLIISTVVSYVLASMAQEPFSIIQTLVLAGIIAVVVFIMDKAVLTEQEE